MADYSYIPDRLPEPLERLEASAERWANENISGDLFKCGCGRMCKLMDGEVISENPYAPPICPECFEEWLKDAKENR